MTPPALAPAIVVVDTSAIMAVLNDEPGAARVLAALPGGVISTVNLAEVFANLAARGVSAAESIASVAKLGLRVEAFGRGDAQRTGWLRPATRHAGLGLGDRACLALAQRLAAPVLTADRAWSRVDLGIVVEQIR